MRIITVPANLRIKMPRQGFVDPEEKDYSFKEYVTDCLDAAQAKTVKQVRTSSRIIDFAEKANGTLTLEDEDYNVLKEVASPGPFFVKVARQLLSFVDAIEKAEEVKK